MKKMSPVFSFLLVLMLISSHCIGSFSKAKTDNNADKFAFSTIPDSITVDTIAFRDMNDEYAIRQYKSNGNIIQMDIDRYNSYTTIDYILWDMDKNGRMEAIGVYNVLEQKYDYHLIEEDLVANDLLEYLVQLEDIGFPSFYDSSDIPKAVYKSKEHQPELNYYRYED
ncbi:MAG: ABC-type glycerol-3-phosphate transport system substrate-binding protein [Saprospiraceae bacterium]|jgi:ABC-type glycerol-3-phosphate transport system substrate-binding protein